MKFISIRLKFKDPPDKRDKPVIDDFSLLHFAGGLAIGTLLGNTHGQLAQLGWEGLEVIKSRNNPANRFYEPLPNKVADIIITGTGVYLGSRLRDRLVVSDDEE